jgi:ketosteroid isomerase-like protein
MKKAILLISVVGITLGLNSCKNGNQNSFKEADKEAIQITSKEAVKLLNETKDFKAYVNAYYAENATVLTPNSEPLSGREAIITANQSFGNSEMNVEINDINGRGDLAYVYGKYNLVLQPGGIRDNGKYIEIWKKQLNGKWQVIYDIWNTNIPVKNDPAVIKE